MKLMLRCVACNRVRLSEQTTEELEIADPGDVWPDDFICEYCSQDKTPPEESDNPLNDQP